MTPPVGALIGLPLAGAMLAIAVARGVRRERPWAHVAVAAVALSNLSVYLPGVNAEAGLPPWAIGLAFLSWIALLLVYPDGRVQPCWAVLPLLALGVLIGWRAGTSGTFDSGGWSMALFVGLLGGVGAQVWRYLRRSSIAERDAVRWLLVGAVPALTFLLGLSILEATTVLTDAVYALPWVSTGSSVAFWLVPLAAVVGLLSPARLAADRAIYTAATLCGATLLLTEAYFLLLPVTGAGWATMVVLLLEVPALLAARRAASVLVYGRDARPALARLGRKLEGTIRPDEVPGTLAEAVRSALFVPYAAVLIPGSGIAETGTPPAEVPAGVERFPVLYNDEPIAVILVAARTGERALSGRDRAVLDQLAKRAGAALHGTALVAQLRTAREDLLRAREEEHRRLRRDLHDDLAPTLAGLGMRSAAVATLISTNPDQAAVAAGELEGGIRRAAEQVREIAYDLRPRLLDDRGLVDAVRDRLLRDVEMANLPVTVDADDLGRLPAAVEAAALRIVSESVANVRRHAQASTCKVQLRRRNGNLHLEVSDDGHGIAADARTGIGLISIAERAAELGGRSEVCSTADGTVVRVLLPIEESL